MPLRLRIQPVAIKTWNTANGVRNGYAGNDVQRRSPMSDQSCYDGTTSPVNFVTAKPDTTSIAPMLLRLSPNDNVAVATGNFDATAQTTFDGALFQLLDRIDVGHKVALCEIPAGGKVIKFGCPIGSATRPIRAGEHVHTHNLKSDYLPTFTLEAGRQFDKR